MSTANFPLIKTDRLLLRQILESDLGNIYLGLSNPDVIKYYGVSYHSLEETKRQMDFYNNLLRDEIGIWWAVCSHTDNAFLGAGGLNSLSKTHKKAEIGFWLLPKYWGQGIMTEAIPLICKYGFENMNLHRIEGIVESDNINCKNAITKLSFKHEGTMKDCEIKNGKFISLDIYAIISD